MRTVLPRIHAASGIGSLFQYNVHFKHYGDYIYTHDLRTSKTCQLGVQLGILMRNKPGKYAAENSNAGALGLEILMSLSHGHYGYSKGWA